MSDTDRHWPRNRHQRVTGASNLIELTMRLRQEKPLAVAVTDPAKVACPWVWLPRSQIEIEHISDNIVTVTMPEWLAKDKELI